MYILYFIYLFIQETQIIKGIVLNQDSEAIAAASIYLSNSRAGTYTDEKGQFEIKCSVNDSSIEVDHISYIKRSFKINNENKYFLFRNKVSSELVSVVAEKLKRFKPLQGKIVNEKIEQTASANIQTLLNQEAGIDVNPESGIKLMGFDPEYTLILVDGQKVYSGDDGFTNLDIINLDNVQELEIINGPSSFIYGRGALAGVINIKTKKPLIKENAISNSIKTAFGSNNSRRLSNTFRYTNSKIDFTVNTNLLAKDRYVDRIPSNLIHLSPELRYTLTKELQFNLVYRFTNENYKGKSKDSNNSIKDYNSDFHHLFFLTEWYISDSFNHKLNLSINTRSTRLHEKADFENSFYFKDDDEQATNSIDYISELNMNPLFNIYIGFGYLEENYSGSLVDLSHGIQNNKYLFISNEMELFETKATSLDMLIGARIDKHNRYDTYVSPKIAFDLNYNNFNFKTEYGSGFKSPSFTEMYMSFDNSSYFVVGANEVDEFHTNNAAHITNSIKSEFDYLKPESNKSFSSAITFKFSKLRLTNSYVLNQLDNYIELQHVFTLNQNRKIFSYQNISDLSSHQYLSTIDYQFDKNVTTQLSYRYLNIFDNSVQKDFETKKVRDRFSNIVPEENYGGLFSRSKHVLKLNLSYSYKVIVLNAHLNWNSKFGNREKDDGNLILDQDFEYDPSYTISSISIHYNYSKSIIFNTSINNLFNYKHDYLHYNGRLFSISMNYKF